MVMRAAIDNQESNVDSAVVLFICSVHEHI